MLKTFNCPACGGPLEYSSEAGQVVRCRFCGQSVMTPERARETPVISTAAVGRGIRWFVVISLVVVGVGTAFFFMLRSSSVSMPALPAVPNPFAALPGGSSFRVALSFGEEGIGPGRFEDARHIALDGEGYLYVGEYSGGRIQRFDSTGRFMTQWLVDTERPLRGLAADRNGIVYVVQGGKIQRYRGATGEALDAWSGPPRFRPDGVYPTPDGGMLVFGGGASPAQVVRFDAQGQVSLGHRRRWCGARGTGPARCRRCRSD